MDKNHFELAFFPKDLHVIKKFEKRLSSTELLENEVRRILRNHKIEPTKIYITKVKEGRGRDKLEDMFEGFRYKKFKGKVRGVKKGFLRDKLWKNDFYIYLLFGKNRDGILYKTEADNLKEAKKIGQSIYARLMESVLKQGPVPWNYITRIAPAS